jgi:hypothetical protein
MKGAFGRRTGIRRKKKSGRKSKKCAVFVVLVSFSPGSDLITRHTGVAAAQTPRRALLIHALGPVRALVIDPDSAVVHSWNWRPLGNQPTTPPPKWLYLTNVIKTKARSSEGRKKRRNQNRISFLITLLWGAHSGGERESVEKNQGENKMCVILVVLVSFSSGATSLRDTRGSQPPKHRAGPF